MDNVDKLITPMELTGEVLNTQFYDTVDGYKTLEYNSKNCRIETYEEQLKYHYKIFFDFETIHLSISICHIYVGFTTMIHNKFL